MKVADQITVLRSGQVTGQVKKTETTTDKLARMMVGTELQEVSDRRQLEGRPLLEVKGLTVGVKNAKPVLDNVSLTVNRGEILGIAGKYPSTQKGIFNIDYFRIDVAFRLILSTRILLGFGLFWRFLNKEFIRNRKNPEADFYF